MTIGMRGRYLPIFLAMVAALFLLAGCGGPGDGRLPLQGKVTYGGQPVPFGTIYFDPDASKGNAGPQGSGEIRDGIYKTNPGFGAIAGFHVVRITAYDGQKPPGPEGKMLPHGNPLPDYRTQIDIPKGARALDFEMPAKAN